MKILHSADFHLNAPFSGRSPEEAEFLRRWLMEVPAMVADLCLAERCDLVLLAGDLFDSGDYTAAYPALYAALERMAVPVFITPGNHDYCDFQSPWLRERWPENVHVFTRSRMESVALPRLDCRVYGAGYESMDCPGLLAGFLAEGEERYHIGVLHADPINRNSPYCPVTAAQIRESGLHYLALGHIHKADSFLTGETLCAWPGCTMGKGYDETGVKGVYIVELEETAQLRFVPLDVPCFYDDQVEAGMDPAAAAAELLPPGGSEDFYRITLTGETENVNVEAIRQALGRYPHLQLRDQTTRLADVWSAVEDDSLEGAYFRMLRDAMEGQTEQQRRRIMLAARISRQILDGQEVKLL